MFDFVRLRESHCSDFLTEMFRSHNRLKHKDRNRDRDRGADKNGARNDHASLSDSRLDGGRRQESDSYWHPQGSRVNIYNSSASQSLANQDDFSLSTAILYNYDYIRPSPEKTMLKSAIENEQTSSSRLRLSNNTHTHTHTHTYANTAPPHVYSHSRCKDLKAHFGCVNALGFSKCGDFLLSGGDDKRVLVCSYIYTFYSM
jgi:hypothetical protein